MTLLNKMFGTHRAIYNKLVEVSGGDCYKLSKKDLAAKYRGISQKHSMEKYLPSYHLEVPEEVMDSTYRDFVKAIEASKALFKSLKDKGEKTSFPSLKFKSRKDNSSSIEIRSRTFKSSQNSRLRFFERYLGKEGILFKESLPDMNYSVRLQRTRDRKYYLCIPRVRSFPKTETNRVCAIDPGVRDFLTIYDPNGLTLGITDRKEKVFQRCLTIDRLQSQLSLEVQKRKRFRLRARIYKLYQKVKRMINDLHQKCSKWLSTNYSEVLLPKFATSEMARKQKRISSKTSRAMLTWSHYKFKELVRVKMERTGGRLIDCTEPYTSKTCTVCGRINRKLTKQKTFECPSCSHVLDRDVNAARNIYLMNEHLLTWTLRVR